ncbi:MAG: hypothetical protein AAB731_00085 [Patescibacteria group bacterium]
MKEPKEAVVAQELGLDEALGSPTGEALGRSPIGRSPTGEATGEAEKQIPKDLAEDIIAAHDTRVKIVGEIIEDTQQMMANFKTKREQMALELQTLLAKGESLRKKDFIRMMADIIATHARREEAVREMLGNFRQEEEMMAEKLRHLLKKGDVVRIRDFKKMMAEIRQWQEKRMQTANGSITEQLQKMQEEVHTMLDNFKTERQSAASARRGIEMLNLFPVEKTAIRPADNPGRKDGENRLALGQKDLRPDGSFAGLN